MWSAAKDLTFYREGDGKCPWCEGDDSGPMHETWNCAALKDIQLLKDPDLQFLSTANTPLHILHGLPSQLEADYTDDIITPLPGILGCASLMVLSGF